MPNDTATDRQRRADTPADRLLKVFAATQRLLRAADAVREATEEMLATAAESEVRHGA